MIPNYNEYLESIKKKLDAMNKAAGVDLKANKEFQKHMQQSEVPANDIFDMLGNGAKMWMEKNKKQNPL